MARGGNGLRLYLDLPSRIEKAGHDHHRRSRAPRPEDVAVNLAYRIGMILGGDEHTGADDVGQGCARRLQGSLDDLEAPSRLNAGIVVAASIGPDRSRPGNEDAVTDPDGSAEADHRLEGRSGRDPYRVAVSASFHLGSMSDRLACTQRPAVTDPASLESTSDADHR